MPVLNTTVNNLQQVRIIPKYQHFVIEVVYKKEVSNDKLTHDNVLGIDLGLNNLATLVSNQPDVNPMLINGKPLKSINQYFNQKKAKLMSFMVILVQVIQLAVYPKNENKKLMITCIKPVVILLIMR